MMLLALSWVVEAHAECSTLCKNNCKAITSLCSANPLTSLYGASCQPFGQVCEASCDQSFCSCFNDALQQCTIARSSCRTGKEITDFVCQLEFDICLAITASQCWFQWFAYGASKALPTAIAMLPQIPVLSDFINLFANGFPSLSSVFKPLTDVFSLPFQFLKVPAQIFKMFLDFTKMIGAFFPTNLLNPLGQLGGFDKLLGQSSDLLNPLKGLTNLGKLMGSQSPLNFLNASKSFGDLGKNLGLPSPMDFTNALQPIQEGLGLPSVSDIFNPGGADKTGKTPAQSSLADLFKNLQPAPADISAAATSPPLSNQSPPQQSSQNGQDILQELTASLKSQSTPTKPKGFLTGLQFPTLPPASNFFNNRGKK